MYAKLRFLAAAAVLIAAVSGSNLGEAAAAPRLRGIVETTQGEKFEGWIRIERETLFLEEIGGAHREFGPAELKVAHMHLAGAAPNSSPGLGGSYFRDRNFGGAATGRVDPVVDFGWGGSAPMPGFPADNFSVRWEGEIETLGAGSYSFHTSSDDGVRLWVDGRPLIDHWVNQAEAERSGSIQLEAQRRYPLKLEYFEGGATAAIHLLWTPPGAGKSVIPQERLSHGSASAPFTNQNGLLGSYFKGTNFDGEAAVRLDPTIDFRWDGQAPAPGLGPSNFSVRWEGEVAAPISGNVTFHATTDDGIRLWVGGRKLIEEWRTMPATEHRGEIPMEAGKHYPIRMEMFQGDGPAQASLAWSGPSLGRQLVPADRLFAQRGSAAQPRRDVGLLLKGGSFLAGQIVKADDKAIELAYIDGETLRIPRLYISSVQFVSIDPTRLAKAAEQKPGCLLRNGDYLESSLLSLDNGKVKASSILFGHRVFNPGEVQLFKLNESGKPEANFELRTRSGSQLRADWMMLDGDRALVKDNSFCPVNLKPGDVAEVYGEAAKDGG